MRRILLLSLLASAGLHAQIAVVNAASYTPGAAVTAGSFVAAFGTFTGVTATTASLPFPTTLAGVKVTVEGIEAPLYDVRSTQITFLIPGAITPGIHPIVVTTGAGTVSGTVRTMSAAPGLFTKDTATPPKGAVINSNGIENSASNAAARGDFISIYGTGPGAFSQPYTDGAAPGSSPLVQTKSTPQVYIGGVEATVQFSGLNSFYPGLWQINAFIPNKAFITGKVAVQVFVDGVNSNEVAIFVK